MTEGKQQGLINLLERLIIEKKELRDALEKIRDRYAPEYGGHIGESEMREIARKAIRRELCGE